MCYYRMAAVASPASRPPALRGGAALYEPFNPSPKSLCDSCSLFPDSPAALASPSFPSRHHTFVAQRRFRRSPSSSEGLSEVSSGDGCDSDQAAVASQSPILSSTQQATSQTISPTLHATSQAVSPTLHAIRHSLENMEIRALEGKLELLATQRQLSAARCENFIHMIESSIAGGGGSEDGASAVACNGADCADGCGGGGFAAIRGSGELVSPPTGITRTCSVSSTSSSASTNEENEDDDGNEEDDEADEPPPFFQRRVSRRRSKEALELTHMMMNTSLNIETARNEAEVDDGNEEDDEADEPPPPQRRVSRRRSLELTSFSLKDRSLESPSIFGSGRFPPRSYSSRALDLSQSPVAHVTRVHSHGHSPSIRPSHSRSPRSLATSHSHDHCHMHAQASRDLSFYDSHAPISRPPTTRDAHHPPISRANTTPLSGRHHSATFLVPVSPTSSRASAGPVSAEFRLSARALSARLGPRGDLTRGDLSPEDLGFIHHSLGESPISGYSNHPVGESPGGGFGAAASSSNLRGRFGSNSARFSCSCGTSRRSLHRFGSWAHLDV
ncbi:unnamed protein product [Closterium sp. Yama58-4]|nr:unnamed protein product [Closterium sp. Yama58-4]